MLDCAQPDLVNGLFKNSKKAKQINGHIDSESKLELNSRKETFNICETSGEGGLLKPSDGKGIWSNCYITFIVAEKA